MSAPVDQFELTTDLPRLAPAEQLTYVGPQTVPDTRLTSGALMFTLVALLISAVGLLYLVQTSRVASLGYEASRLQREREAQGLANEQLSYDVARYESLPLVERVAEEQLGMQPMSAYRYLDVARPALDELPTPAPEATEQPSLARRVLRRITGHGAATHAAEDSQ
jgi:cell division protein FtsL